MESFLPAMVSPPSPAALSSPSSAASLMPESTGETRTGSAPGAQRCRPLGDPIVPPPKNVCALVSAISSLRKDIMASEDGLPSGYISLAGGISGGLSASAISSSAGAVPASKFADCIVTGADEASTPASCKCNTGADGGSCAGWAIGGTLPSRLVLLSGNSGAAAAGGVIAGCAAGAASIGCNCGKVSGSLAAGAGLTTGKRSPL